MLYRISVAERGLTGIANIFRSRLSRLDDLLRAGTVPLMMKTTAQGRVVRFTPFRNFNFERKFQTIAGDNSHQSLRDSYFVQL